MLMMRMHILLFSFLILPPTVWTILLDIRYPQFFHLSPNDSAVEITEGKTPGSFIAFLTIINGTHDEWSLNCSHDDFQVIFNGISYSLITRQTLDREREDFYQLIIMARHLDYPYETLSRTIRLRILDLNDSPPKFNQTLYRTTLIPNQTTFTIEAFDADQPGTDNSRISYSLANYHDIFRINQTSGTIECVKNVLSNYDRYEVIVEARDHGKPSLSSSVLVQIELVRARSLKSLVPSPTSSWFSIEQRPENMLIFTGIFASVIFIICLCTCLICSIRYKFKRRNSTMRKISTNPTAPAIHLYLPENMNNSNNNDLTGCTWSCDSSEQSSNQYLLLNYPPPSAPASYV